MKNLGLLGLSLVGLVACGGGEIQTVVEQDVEPGGTVSTDPDGVGVSPENPVSVSVTSPNGGTVRLEIAEVTEDAPSGVTFLGQQINITAPDADADDPLVIVFTLDGSAVPEDENEGTIQMFRSARLVPAECASSTAALPNPCTADRDLVGDDVVLTVRTGRASPWNFGTVGEDANPPTAEGKGELDISALQDGEWPVRINGDLGVVELPFSTPLPSSIDDLEDPGEEIAEALTLLIESDETETTASLMDGTLVDGAPDEPGEYSCAVNEDRTEATIRFYNESEAGLTVKTDRTYTVMITIDGSDYVEDLDASTFTVQPE